MVADALKDTMAPVYILRLWAHCQERKADTFVMPTRGLKAQCKYPGEADVFEAALIEAGFIERRHDTVYVIGWAEKNASLLAAWANGTKGGRPRKEPMGNPAVTQRQPTENPDETDKSREDKSRKEREPRATRLADSWTLPEDWKAFCVSERPDLDPDFTAKRFADYWHGKPGKDGRKLDWLATWRNWVRGERQGPNAAPAGHTVPSRAADDTARYLAERREQEQHATLPPAALLAKVRGAVKTEAA